MLSDSVANQESTFDDLKTDNVQSKDSTKHSSGRVALKPLNQNISRVQPFRVAKQNATQEGFFSLQSNSMTVQPSATTCGFKIFDDSKENEKKTCKKENKKILISKKLPLHPSVMSLPTQRVPLSTLHKEDTPSTSLDSLSMMDVSEEERLNIFDIDSDENTNGFSEYVVDIFQHLREAEVLHRPKPFYMRRQQDINVGMRSILVDWLIEVAEEYNLHNETIHLAVNYIDRFLSQMAVLRGKLQLVGTAAMFIATKFEEIYPPDVGDFANLTDNTYTKKQVLRMEHLILKALNFDVAVPTSNQFLKRYLHAAKADKKTEFLAQYLCELALLEFDCVQYLPSKIASSSVCLASLSVSGKLWNETMEFYMNYKLDDLKPCIRRLHELGKATNGHPQQAIPDKYKDAKYDCVAEFKMPATLPFDHGEQSSAE